jgi:hypothetical protein
LIPSSTKLFIFTDGCAGQYKNKTNFANLCHFSTDFGLLVEWHFHATAHGKSACDGIGGILKRLARRASLQDRFSIQSAAQLLNWACEHVKNIKVFLVSTYEITTNSDMLSKRNKVIHAVPGTRDFHCIVPINRYQIKASVVSSGN